MKKYMSLISAQLRDNSGSEYIESLILMAMAFTVGGSFITMFWAAIHAGFATSLQQQLQALFS